MKCFWYWCDIGHQISLVGDPEALERAWETGKQEKPEDWGGHCRTSGSREGPSLQLLLPQPHHLPHPAPPLKDKLHESSVCMHAKSRQSCPTLCDTMDLAHQAPLSKGFSRQEYWRGLPCPPSGDLPDPGIEPTSLISPALAGGFFTTSATREAP